MFKQANKWVLGGLAAVAALAAAPAHAGKTLDAIKQRGQLVCGVNTGLAGLLGRPTARATGPASTSTSARPSPPRSSATRNKVKYVPLNAQQRFTALQSGEIDILSRNTTWTLTRDASLGLHFVGVDLLRRPGLHGAGQGQDQERQGAEGRDGLRAVGHDHREEPDRLLARQQARTSSRSCSRSSRGRHRRLLLRPLPGVHHRRLGPRLDPQQGSEGPEGARDPARADLQGAARPGRCAAATTSSSRSPSG